MGTEALPRISPAPLPYFQLLSQTAKFRKHRVLCSLRIRIGTSSTAARTLCVRIRCDARARAPAGKRARAWHARTSHAIPEARRRAEAGLTRGRPVLAGSLLRFQRLERAQVRGKAPLHTPQSREAWVGRAVRGLDLEQLPPGPVEIESLWMARRREHAGIFPIVVVRPLQKTPAQAQLGRGTLESRNAR
jgi:hypothetical protein